MSLELCECFKLTKLDDVGGTSCRGGRHRLALSHGLMAKRYSQRLTWGSSVAALPAQAKSTIVLTGQTENAILAWINVGPPLSAKRAQGFKGFPPWRLPEGKGPDVASARGAFADRS